MERRDFLQFTVAGLAAALLEHPLAVAAARESTIPALLDASEWRLLEAICACILPPVNGISTADAGCVNFIDKLLANEEATLAPAYRAALVAFDSAVRTESGQGLAALGAERQTAFLERLEDGQFSGWPETVMGQAELFGLLRWHTLLGFLADPRHGGNRDGIGWRALGHPGHLHEHGGISDEQLSGAVPI